MYIEHCHTLLQLNMHTIVVSGSQDCPECHFELVVTAQLRSWEVELLEEVLWLLVSLSGRQIMVFTRLVEWLNTLQVVHPRWPFDSRWVEQAAWGSVRTLGGAPPARWTGNYFLLARFRVHVARALRLTETAVLVPVSCTFKRNGTEPKRQLFFDAYCTLRIRVANSHH